MSTFIECENLVKIYKVAELEVIALQGLYFKVEQGEMIALVGPSGSGKSTLMNVLGGLDTPSAGKARVGEYRLTEMTPKKQVDYRRNVVGFIWQQTAYNLLSYLTVLENVEMPMAFNGIPRKERRERAERLLVDVGLQDRLNFRPEYLSGGEQQRTALAVAMANLPQLLLADEPTGEVDAESSAMIFEVMARLTQEYGVTIVIVTHDYEVANRVNRVIGMRDGNASVEVLRRQGEDGLPITEEEFSVLDRTGRLQLPKGYLEQLKMENLVRLRLEDDHIRIYPGD
jgi:ABC-type lipoprotein export system ATPase subunit